MSIATAAFRYIFKIYIKKKCKYIDVFLQKNFAHEFKIKHQHKSAKNRSNFLNIKYFQKL